MPPKKLTPFQIEILEVLFVFGDYKPDGKVAERVVERLRNLGLVEDDKSPGAMTFAVVLTEEGKHTVKTKWPAAKVAELEKRRAAYEADDDE